ncbi:MAG: MBL fold metallo-hydrolase [Candidatus Lokiarchaeota archaeon]|nr:MBL fold metallo-hydrolase [Candidatus Lokiarchaeota archaeon]
MILKRLIVGPLGTNSYIFGSNESKEVVIIDVGGEPETFIDIIEEKLHVKPIGLLLTHGHYDHTLKLGKLLSYFNIPLMYSKKEFDSGIYTHKKADRWLSEGDSIKVGEITLDILETPGHSPGALSYCSKDVKEYDSKKIDGVIFTGDLIFRRSIGRSDLRGGDPHLLLSSIKTKIMYNPEITDNFLIFPGHMDITSVGEERKLNMFKNYFL